MCETLAKRTKKLFCDKENGEDVDNLCSQINDVEYAADMLNIQVECQEAEIEHLKKQIEDLKRKWAFKTFVLWDYRGDYSHKVVLAPDYGMAKRLALSQLSEMYPYTLPSEIEAIFDQRFDLVEDEMPLIDE